jgi:hypothetical protein
MTTAVGVDPFCPRNLRRVVRTTGGVRARIERVTHRVDGIFKTGASSLPEAGCGAGDWAVDGDGVAGDRRSASGVSERPASRGLVGAGASAIFQWGQGRLGGFRNEAVGICGRS